MPTLRALKSIDLFILINSSIFYASHVSLLFMYDMITYDIIISRDEQYCITLWQKLVNNLDMCIHMHTTYILCVDSSE